jgi:hypothetical protein
MNQPCHHGFLGSVGFRESPRPENNPAMASPDVRSVEFSRKLPAPGVPAPVSYQGRGSGGPGALPPWPVPVHGAVLVLVPVPVLVPVADGRIPCLLVEDSTLSSASATVLLHGRGTRSFSSSRSGLGARALASLAGGRLSRLARRPFPLVPSRGRRRHDLGHAAHRVAASSLFLPSQTAGRAKPGLVRQLRAEDEPGSPRPAGGGMSRHLRAAVSAAGSELYGMARVPSRHSGAGVRPGSGVPFQLGQRLCGIAAKVHETGGGGTAAVR